MSIRAAHRPVRAHDAAGRTGRRDRATVAACSRCSRGGCRRAGATASSPGTGRVLEALGDFRFGTAELDWLADERVVDDRTLAFLADYRFTGSIVGYAEGEAFFPSSPVLVVEGTFAEAVLLETLVLSILNYDSAVASAASRMTSAAVDRPCLEMGSRRAHEQAAVAAARAAVVAGFAGTSNLEAGRRYGLPTIGTAAHAFTLLHDDEEAAFAAQVASLGHRHHAARRHLRRAPRRGARAGGCGHRARRGAARLRRPRRARRRGAPASSTRPALATTQDRRDLGPRRVRDRGARRRTGRRLRRRAPRW